jgi:UDP-glucuronate 4-epimerase
MKRICITGIAGFIGFHLARKLKRLGHTVVGIDNFNDYYAPKLKRDRANILKQEGIVASEHDIHDAKAFQKLLEKEQINHCIHLAAQAGVRLSLQDPQRYIHNNIVGFCSILEVLRHMSIPLIYASSSSVYGTNKKIPFSVHDQTDSAANMYGVTKKSNELMARTYHHLYQMPMVGLRFFTVYGPWGRPDMAYYSFTKAIWEGKPIDVYNFGNMRRDFTYIDDIVDGICSALSIETGEHIFNLGNERPEKVRTLIEYIEQELGKKAKLNELPMQPGEIVETFADIEESKKTLGFQPRISLKEGISQFIEWFKEYHLS